MPFGAGRQTHTLEARVEPSGIGAFKRKLAGATSAVGGLKNAVAGASAVIGGAFVAGFGAAINEARKFEQAMVEVEKVTDPETARQMSAAVKDMAETIPLAQEELAGIAADAARFGVRGPKNIRNFTEAVSKMATATDLSSERAGEALAKLAQLTGTPIEQVEHLGSAINELSNNFATSSSEIVDSMLRSSAALSQLGVSQTDIAGLSAALNAVSESSQRAGTRMRRLAQEMVDPGKVGDLASTFDMTTDQFKAMVKEDPTGTIVKMAKAMKEGGDQADMLNSTLSTSSRQALSGLGQNLEGVTEALGMSADAFEENTSLQSEFAAATDTFNAQLQLNINRLTNVAIAIGEKLLPALTDFLKFTKPLISRLEDFADGLSQAQVELAAAGSAIATVAGTVGLFASGPLGLAVAALGMLTYKMVKHREEIQSSLLPIYEAIVEEVAATRESFRQLGAAAEPALRPIRTALSTVAGAVETATGRVQSDIQTGILGAVRRAGRVVRSVLGRATATFTEHGVAIGQTITSTYTSARDTVSRSLGRIETLWSDHGGTVERQASTAYGKAKSTANTALSTLQNEVLNPAFEKVESLWDEHGGAVEGTIGDIATSIKEDPVGALRTALELIPGPLSKFGAAFIDTFDNIKENAVPEFESAIEGIGDAVRLATEGKIGKGLNKLNDAFEDTLQGTRIAVVGEDGKSGIVGKMIEQTRSSLETAAGGIATAAETGFKNPIVTAAEQTAIALIGGIDGGGEGLVDKLIGEIASFLKSDAALDLTKAASKMWGQALRETALEIFNLLMWRDDSLIKTVISDIGTYLITDAWSDLKEAAEIMFDGMMAAAEGFAEGLIGKSLIPEMIGDIASYLSGEAATDLKQAVGRMVGAMKTRAENWVDNFKRPFENAVGDVKGLFNGLKRKLVGGSILPDMLDQTVREVDRWKQPFLKPFREARKEATKEFGRLQSKISSAAKKLTSGGGRGISRAHQRMIRGDRLDNLRDVRRGKLTASALRSAAGGVGNAGVTTAQMLAREMTKDIRAAGGAGRITVKDLLAEVPGLQTGGLIKASGLAQLHAGERVVSAAEVDRSSGGKTFTMHGDINIHTDTSDPAELANDLLAEVNARF